MKRFIKAASAARMLGAFEDKLAEMQNNEVESATQVTGSVTLTDEQRDLLWEVIDKYNTSYPVSGRWEDETAHEQRTIADTFGISLADAKQIMIDELGFDPELRGHMEGDHWAEDLSSCSNVNAAEQLQLFDDDGYHNYEDTDGIYTGVPGSYVTIAELKNYWNDFYDDDPVLNEEYAPDQGGKWLKDTLRYMKEVEGCDSVNASNALHTGRDENTWYIDTNGQFTGHPGEKVSRADLIDYWNENLGDDPSLEGDLEGWLDHTVEFMEPVYSSIEEVDEELEPVKGEQEWGDDQVFMLMDYTSGTEGMESDTFDCIGKFFAADESDAKRQLERAKRNNRRIKFLDNPYISQFNEYFDNGDEVYVDLDTLLNDAWIDPNDYDGNMPEEPVFDSTEVDDLEACGDVPVEGGSDNYYFGKEQAEKYGDLICDALSGQTVSKRRDTAEQPGGLIYEADQLGLDM